MRPLRELGIRQRRALIVAEDEGRGLAEAKRVARYLLTEIARADCTLAVTGTALATLLGAVAAQVRPESKENFYQDVLLAAQESEAEWQRAYASYMKAH